MSKFKNPVFKCFLILLTLKCFDCYPYKLLPRSPDSDYELDQPAYSRPDQLLNGLLRAHRSALNPKSQLFAQKKHSSFLKNVTLFKHTQLNKKQPKFVLVNVSSLASSPPRPYLSASPKEESKANRIDFLYEDLKFYLISTMNLNQLKLISEIAEQKDDFLDLIVKKEHRQVLTNIRKLVNYLQYKEVLFFGEHKDDLWSINELLQGGRSGLPNDLGGIKNSELLGTLCKSELPIESLIRMFILNEWINKQSNKTNFFDFQLEEPIAALEENFKQVKSDFLARVCSGSD